tara:strand:- start:37 stop:609 length:573 start_codon:yes stop_codon:yes gene_type:complete
MRKTSVNNFIDNMEKFRCELYRIAHLFYEEKNLKDLPSFNNTIEDLQNYFTIRDENLSLLQAKWIKIANTCMSLNIYNLDKYSEKHVHPKFRISFFENSDAYKHLEKFNYGDKTLPIFCSYFAFLSYLRLVKKCDYVCSALEIIEDIYREKREWFVHILTMWDNEDLSNSERLRRIEYQLFQINQKLKIK